MQTAATTAFVELSVWSGQRSLVAPALSRQEYSATLNDLKDALQAAHGECFNAVHHIMVSADLLTVANPRWIPVRALPLVYKFACSLPRPGSPRAR